MPLKTPRRTRAQADPQSGLSHESIRDELNRILASREFQATGRRREFLRFVVEEALAGRADQLKGYTIATGVFGRNEHFDPGLDPIVRIQAGRLRRELERYYLVAGGSDPIRIDIPKGRYVPFFVEQPGVDGAAQVLAQASESQDSQVYATPSAAVMPLANLTGDPDQAYFLDGLVSELTVELGRYQDIIAIPCTITPPAPGTPADIKKLAAFLGVRFLLGGTLRKDSETAKIALALTDAATGRQIWADAYKHHLDATGLIASQEQIARDVIATIAGELGVISQRLSRESRRKPPAELTTYEAMLRYYHYMVAMTPDTYEDAFTALQAAVEREPEYGPAWSALANLFAHDYTVDAAGTTAPLDTATEYARKGAALEPGNQLARTVMAYVYLLRGDSDAFSEEAEIALALNPNSPYYAGTIGYLFVFSGEFERGRALVDNAIALNPCHPRWFHHARWLDHYRRGEYDAAYREARMTGPHVGFWDPAICVASLGQLGRLSEAKVFIRELRRLKPDFESRARELATRSLKMDNLVDQFIDGLRKAGLKITAP